MPNYGQLRPYNYQQETSPYQGKFDPLHLNTYPQFDMAESANYNKEFDP